MQIAIVVHSISVTVLAKLQKEDNEEVLVPMVQDQDPYQLRFAKALLLVHEVDYVLGVETYFIIHRANLFLRTEDH